MRSITPTEENLLPLLQAFPDQFDLYDFGNVKLQSAHHRSYPTTGFGFRLYGDLNVWLLILFPKGQDQSLYAELGNILASRIATRLNEKNGLDMMISPPHLLDESQILRVTQSSDRDTLLRCSYTHTYKDILIPVEALLISRPLEESGYA